MKRIITTIYLLTFVSCGSGLFAAARQEASRENQQQKIVERLTNNLKCIATYVGEGEGYVVKESVKSAALPGVDAHAIVRRIATGVEPYVTSVRDVVTIDDLQECEEQLHQLALQFGDLLSDTSFWKLYNDHGTYEVLHRNLHEENDQVRRIQALYSIIDTVANEIAGVESQEALETLRVHAERSVMDKAREKFRSLKRGAAKGLRSTFGFIKTYTPPAFMAGVAAVGYKYCDSLPAYVWSMLMAGIVGCNGIALWKVHRAQNSGSYLDELWARRRFALTSWYEMDKQVTVDNSGLAAWISRAPLTLLAGSTMIDGLRARLAGAHWKQLFTSLGRALSLKEGLLYDMCKAVGLGISQRGRVGIDAPIVLLKKLAARAWKSSRKEAVFLISVAAILTIVTKQLRHQIEKDKVNRGDESWLSFSRFKRYGAAACSTVGLTSLAAVVTNAIC